MVREQVQTALPLTLPELAQAAVREQRQHGELDLDPVRRGWRLPASEQTRCRSASDRPAGQWTDEAREVLLEPAAGAAAAADASVLAAVAEQRSPRWEQRRTT